MNTEKAEIFSEKNQRELFDKLTTLIANYKGSVEGVKNSLENVYTLLEEVEEEGLIEEFVLFGKEVIKYDYLAYKNPKSMVRATSQGLLNVRRKVGNTIGVRF